MDNKGNHENNHENNPLKRYLSDDNLRCKPLLKAFAFVGFPVMASLLGRSLLTFLDNVFVGHLPRADVKVAAVATASLLWMVNFRLALGLTTAVTTLVAQKVGEEDYEEAERYTLAGIVGNLLGPGAITLLIALFSYKFFSFLRLPHEVLALAVRYFEIMAIPSVIGYGLFALAGYYRGKGLTQIPMYFDFLGLILNAILDYVLIFGKFGAPRLGIIGAAIGTSAAILIRGGLLLLATQLKLIDGPNLGKYKEIPLNEMISKVKEIYLLGIPASLEGLIMSGSQLIVIYLIAPMGALIIATYRLTIRLQGILFLLGIGFSVANNSIIGQLYGMRKFQHLRRAGWCGALSSGGLSLIIGALMFAFAPQVASLITSNEALREAIAWSIRWIVPAVVLFNVIYPLSGALKGTGDTRTPLKIMFVTRLLLRIPAIYITLTYLGGGLREIWMIINGDNLIRFVWYALAWKNRAEKLSEGIKGGKRDVSRRSSSSAPIKVG